MILPSVPTKRVLPSVPTDRFLPNVPTKRVLPSLATRTETGPKHGKKHGPKHGKKHGPKHGKKRGPKHGPKHGPKADRKWTEVCLCVFLHIKKCSVHFSVPSKTSTFQPRWEGCWRVPFCGFRSRYWGPFWGPFLGASSGASLGLCSVCFQALRNPHGEVCTESQAVCTLMMKCA